MGLKNKLFLSCKRASELVDQKLAGEITYVQNMQLRMHLSMCRFCSAYEKQSTFIQRVLEMRLESGNRFKESNPELKQKILDDLKSQD